MIRSSRNALLALLAVGTLSACSKTDKQVIIASCQSSDEEASEAFCECSYDQMEAQLSPQIMAAIAEEIRDGAKSPPDAVSRLPQSQQFQTLPVLPSLLLNCLGAE